MRNKTSAANCTANLCYRILNTDAAQVRLVLHKLATAPHSPEDASYNAIVLRESQDVFQALRKLDAAQFDCLSQISMDAVSCTVDMRILAERIHNIEQAAVRHEEQLARARWLIGNKASNQMILQLCTCIHQDEIKKIRIELNMPVVRGRLKMPAMDKRIAVHRAWYESRHETDCYLRYRSLKAQFPEFDLGQLHTIVTDNKLNGGA